ncbi:hypothetical protein CANINC_003058 [Pichia inconspicua]|uniref:Endoplasmic reticulum transmembrane protein n=1 Tax=Pichia inconspicua TaxID=52247 RepID=A0A4T0X188_9ASCO|nr:hypothetical protein CANINC_003058 [[Candida] inconspicua]
MAFQYVLTFSLLVLEMILFSLISLPLPSKMRRPLLKTLYIPFSSQQFQVVMKCVIVFIGIMFIDSVNRTFKVNNDLNPVNPIVDSIANGTISRSEIQSRRFYSQRNMYLCGFTLFLSLVLTRTYSMVFELLEVKEKIAKLEKDGGAVDSTELKEKIATLEKEREILLQKSKALNEEL